jgi:hypothetical protein
MSFDKKILMFQKRLLPSLSVCEQSTKSGCTRKIVVISVRVIGVVSVVHGATGGTGREVQQSWVELGVWDGREVIFILFYLFIFFNGLVETRS